MRRKPKPLDRRDRKASERMKKTLSKLERAEKAAAEVQRLLRAREASEIAERAITEVLEKAGDDTMAEGVRLHFAISRKLAKITGEEP